MDYIWHYLCCHWRKEKRKENKILDTLDNALNDLSSEDFDILIQRIQEYIDDLN